MVGGLLFEKNTIKKESKTKRLSLIGLLLCVVVVVIIVAGEVIVACRSIITIISNLLREQGILVITYARLVSQFHEGLYMATMAVALNRNLSLAYYSSLFN